MQSVTKAHRLLIADTLKINTSVMTIYLDKNEIGAKGASLASAC
jgi:hypothetical protein